MSDFMVPKRTGEVIVHAPPLEDLEYSIFLASATAGHGGHETVSDLVNHKSRFLAAKDESGEFRLLRISAIHWIKLLEPKVAEEYFMGFREGASTQGAGLEFDDGASMVGALLALAPAGHTRLSDLLNEGEGFLHLENDSGFYLVNPERITCAHLAQIEEE